MPSEGCVTGAVAGSSRSLSSWSVVDAGATAVVLVMSLAAAACCPTAAAAALLSLYIVSEGAEFVSAAVGPLGRKPPPAAGATAAHDS